VFGLNKEINLKVEVLLVERTFVMIKPDGMQRGLAGAIIQRLQSKGYKPVGLKLMMISPELAQEHYAEHKDKPFFGELVDFITSGPVLPMVWEGPGVISGIRTIMGKTNPSEAAPGTIRGDMGISLSQNVIHGSDSPASAEREINLFFRPEELLTYDRALDTWIF
jgi:nucleoside-diphosphate kinase